MSARTANSFQNNELIHVYALGTDSAIWRRRLGGASLERLGFAGWVIHLTPQYGRAPTSRRGILLHWAQITRYGTSSFLTRRPWQLLADEDRLLTTRARGESPQLTGR